MKMFRAQYCDSHYRTWVFTFKAKSIETAFIIAERERVAKKMRALESIDELNPRRGNGIKDGVTVGDPCSGNHGNNSGNNPCDSGTEGGKGSPCCNTSLTVSSVVKPVEREHEHNDERKAS